MPNSNKKDQGRRDTKYTSPKATATSAGGGGKQQQHQPRAITDKFDCYRVPLDQVQNLGGQATGNATGNLNVGGGQQQEYYHFEQKYQATSTGGPAAAQPVQPVYWTTVPYSSLQYNYESYAHQQQQMGNAATVQGQYPLPQMDPNYYHAYGYPNTPPAPAPAAATPAANNFGHAPYASPWVTAEDRPKSPAPVVKANDNDDIMQKLEEMHGQMTKMVRMLSEEINNSARNARRDAVAAQNVPRIEGGVRQFNVLLAQFNTMCKGIKEQKQKLQQQQQQQQQKQQPNFPNMNHSLSLASRNETASTAFAAYTPTSPSPTKSPKNGSNYNGQHNQEAKNPPQMVSAADQKQLAEKMEQLNSLFHQAKSLGVELHNSMLASSVAMPSKATPSTKKTA